MILEYIFVRVVCIATTILRRFYEFIRCIQSIHESDDRCKWHTKCFRRRFVDSMRWSNLLQFTDDYCQYHCSGPQHISIKIMQIYSIARFIVRPLIHYIKLVHCMFSFIAYRRESELSCCVCTLHFHADVCDLGILKDGAVRAMDTDNFKHESNISQIKNYLLTDFGCHTTRQNVRNQQK